MTMAITADSVAQRLTDPLADCRHRDDGLGFVGPDVPIEMLLASRRPYGHLPWNVDVRSGIADRWLESSFPFWARSIVEQWHHGQFDALDSVIFSRADDASQRLYYYVNELRRRGKLAGPEPVMFDIALIPRDTSAAHTKQAIVELMDRFDIDMPQLEAGIVQADRLRERMARLASERNADGPAYERLARAALWTDPGAWLTSAGMPAADGAAAQRILLAGSVPPDDRLHAVVEAAGASVVAEAHVFGTSRFGRSHEPGNESPVRMLARKLRRDSIAPRAFFDRAAWLVEQARAARASGVIIWLTREDEGLAWSVPAQHRALTAAGLRCLLLTARSWRADDGASEQIAAFCREGQRATA